MPELPEVESVRRQLAPELAGRTVTDVWWDRHPNVRMFGIEQAVGRRVLAVTRRGKFMLCPLDLTDDGDDLELVLHLGMTGSFHLLSPAAEAGELTHVRARFELDDGRTLAFRDPRRFGRISVVPAGDYEPWIPTLARLGPEPLSEEFDVAAFAAALRRTSAPVKAKLLDQSLVAGVGNIYADEALWRARIHPASRKVGPRRAAALHAAIRDVLAAAIEREGTTFRDYQLVNGESGRYLAFLDAYGRAGEPCARCGTTLRRTLIAQRGTTYCPRCQRA